MQGLHYHLAKKAKTHTLSSQNTQDEGVEKSHFNNKYGIVCLEDIEDLYKVGLDTDKYIIIVTLNNKLQSFEVDSGASFSLLSETDFNKLGLDVPLQST